MTVNVSTKFKEMILGSNSFANIFAGGRILLYEGAQPVNADAAVLVPAVAEITTNGVAWAPGGTPAGLTFEQFGAWITKNQSTSWKLKIATTCTPTWFRLVGAATDAGDATYALPRIDGAVGTLPPSDLLVPAATMNAGQVFTMSQFLYTIPPIN